MKALIIEDERPAAQKLKRLLDNIFPALEVAAVLESVEDSVNWLQQHPPPDLVFMDVQLEDGICFEIFEQCTLKSPVIFTTAYDQYSLKAFKVNTVDYLLKPVDPRDLEQAVRKYMQIHRPPLEGARLASLSDMFSSGPKERFLVRVGAHFRSVPVAEVRCFYISERSTFMFVEGGMNYAIDYSLDRVERVVDSRHFFRINRHFIVNYNAIGDVIAYSSSRLRVILNNWTESGEIVVSRERVGPFKEWMDR